MATKLSQEQLEELVVGKYENPNAIFFEHAALDVPRSKEAGRRMYRKMVYIKLSQPGITDSMSYPAKKEDIDRYPDEYQYFLNNKQGKRRPAIDIIPNLDIAHLQELRDYGILTIPQLADMEVVPPHLEYAHNAAKVFNKALEEMDNDEIETEVKEDTRTPAQKVGFRTREEAAAEREETTQRGQETESFTRSPDPILKKRVIEGQVMPPQDRRTNGADVGQRSISSGNSGREERETAERDDPGGRKHSGKSVNWIDNWQVEFKQVR